MRKTKKKNATFGLNKQNENIFLGGFFFFFSVAQNLPLFLLFKIPSPLPFDSCFFHAKLMATVWLIAKYGRTLEEIPAIDTLFFFFFLCVFRLQFGGSSYRTPQKISFFFSFSRWPRVHFQNDFFPLWRHFLVLFSVFFCFIRRRFLSKKQKMDRTNEKWLMQKSKILKKRRGGGEKITCKK